MEHGAISSGQGAIAVVYITDVTGVVQAVAGPYICIGTNLFLRKRTACDRLRPGHFEDGTRDPHDPPDALPPHPYLSCAHWAKIAIWASLK